MNEIGKKIVSGIVSVLVIGGVGYAISQSKLVDNFSKETGMSQQEAEEYVKNVKEEDLLGAKELGESYIRHSQETQKTNDEIDCATSTIDFAEDFGTDCVTVKAELTKLRRAEEKIGQAYIKLADDKADRTDTQNVINALDEYVAIIKKPIFSNIFTEESIDDLIKTTAYNKSLLVTALQEDK